MQNGFNITDILYKVTIQIMHANNKKYSIQVNQMACRSEICENILIK